MGLNIIAALFTMLFGTRHIDNTEHHRGMMMAIAFESIVKLVAFLVVGMFILYLALIIIHTVLTMIAIICLPRQFHTMVVENERAQDLHTARWLFPSYLILMALLAFLGGTSAASGMVIVSTIALAIMASNDLVMPLLLRRMR